MASPITSRTIPANGFRFEVHTCGPAESDRLALCLHGFPEHAYSWRHQLPLLAKLGYKVWAPNQRGYGATTPRPAEIAAYHVDHLLDDVAALVDESGARSVTLIGHDWGGILAWLFAMRNVRPLERLVVMNLPHPQRFAWHLEHNKRQKRRSLYERVFQLPRIPEMLFRARKAYMVAQTFRNWAVHPEHFRDEDLEIYRENALAPGAMTAMLNWYRANPFRKCFAEASGTVKAPTFLIWGEHDEALGIEMTLGTEELVPDYRVRYLNASHWVQQDAPDEVNALLEAWLTGQPLPEQGREPSRLP